MAKISLHIRDPDSGETIDVEAEGATMDAAIREAEKGAKAMQALFREMAPP